MSQVKFTSVEKLTLDILKFGFAIKGKNIGVIDKKFKKNKRCN